MIKVLKSNEDECEKLKDYVIEMIYNSEGLHSVKQSFKNLFGTLIDTRGRVIMILYAIILFIFIMMIVSIYLSLYNYLINKTLVVNIFLQIK
jgi:hypothetical protein